MISSLANLYVMVLTDQNKRRKKDCLKGTTRLRKVNGDWAADVGGPEASLLATFTRHRCYLMTSMTPTRLPDGLIIVAELPRSSVVSSNPKSLKVVSDLISASLRPRTFTIEPSF